MLNMFTGIVEEVGKILSFEEAESAWRLVVAASVVTSDVKLGDSIAVNGCCLTVVDFDENSLSFDLLEESKRLTSIGQLEAGGALNLERALLPTTRMGGHFVSGHVDGVATITAIEPRGKDTYLRIEPDVASMHYLVHKGCITVDGISLTVAAVDEASFAVWLIPHTMTHTNLHTKQVGNQVNLEFDLVAKYVEKLTTREKA